MTTNEPIDWSDEFLYHALGANFDTGIALFDRAFDRAEAAYDLHQLDRLLILLNDSTLYQEDKRPGWYHYYRARRMRLEWNLTELEAELTRIPAGLSATPSMTCRIELLRAQVSVMHGMWGDALKRLHDLPNRTLALNETLLASDALLWTANLHVGRVQSSGGWIEPVQRGFAGLLRRCFIGAIVLFAIPLWLVLWWQTGMRGFLRPILRYSGIYSNWSIFVDYLQALNALTQAARIPQADPHVAVDIGLMRADVLLDLHLYAQSLTLLEELHAKYTLDSHQQALATYRQAQIYLETDDLPAAERCLNEVEQALPAEDTTNRAYVNLLRGKLALKRGELSTANAWAAALKIFQTQRNMIAVEEVLRACYAALDELDVHAPLYKTISQVVADVPRKTFAVRFPNRLFNLIQIGAWVIPLTGAVALMLAFLHVIQYDGDISKLLSLADKIIFSGVWLIPAIILLAGFFSSLLGLIGLASTLVQQAIRLEWIVFDQHSIACYNFKGEKIVEIEWLNVQLYLQVEQGLIRGMSRSLSFDRLNGELEENISTIRMPGTAVGFPYLRREVVEILGKLPEPKHPQVYRLRWWAGVFIWLPVVGFILSTFVNVGGISGVPVEWQVVIINLLFVFMFVVVFYLTAAYIRFFVRMGHVVLRRRYFVPLTVGLGLVSFALGLLSRGYLWHFSTIFVFWGMVTLVVFVTVVQRDHWRFTRLLLAVVVVAGAVFTLRDTVMILLANEASIYRQAIIHNREPPKNAFDHLSDISYWLTTLDPSYDKGFANLGMAYYGKGDYDESAQALQRANSIEFPYWADCEALVYFRMGNKRPSRQKYLDYKREVEAEGETLDITFGDWCFAMFREDYQQFESQILNPILGDPRNLQGVIVQ